MMGETRDIKLPSYLPAWVKTFLTQRIDELSTIIHPSGVTKESRVADLIDFLEYSEINNVIKEMAKISETDCAHIIWAGWQYSYAWKNDRMQKYKTKALVKHLDDVKTKLAEFREFAFPREYEDNQKSMLEQHVALILTTSLNKVFQKYVAGDKNTAFAKLLIANPNLLEDCNAFPNTHQILDLIGEQIQEEIDIIRDNPREVDSLLPTKLKAANAKSIALQKKLAKELSERFPSCQKSHMNWLVIIVNALDPDNPVSLDSIRHNIKS